MKTEAQITAEMQDRQDRCEAIIDLAQSEDRDSLTVGEQQEMDSLLGEIRMLQSQRQLANLSESRGRRTAPEAPRHASGDDDGQRRLPPNPSQTPARRRLSEAIQMSGWDVRDNPAVELAIGDVFMTWPTIGDINPTRLPDIRQTGMDTRFLWPNLPSQIVPNATNITDFRQDSRTLTGTVERALGATTDKAVLDPGIELVETALKQFAVVLEDIPQVLFDSLPAVQSYFDSEASFQLNAALDVHTLTNIIAAADDTGAAVTDLVTDVRSAINTMQALGRNPDLLVLTPAQKSTLDLAVQPGDGNYLFLPGDGADRLWRLRVVTVSTATHTDPTLIDTSSIGTVYFGSRVRFMADPYSGMKKNTVRLRYEFSALMHVRAADAALRLVDDTP